MLPVPMTRSFSGSVAISYVQEAYNYGKPGNLREFVKSGKLMEFKIY